MALILRLLANINSCLPTLNNIKPRFFLEQTLLFFSSTIFLPSNLSGPSQVISSTSGNLCRCFCNTSMNDAMLQSQT